MTKNNTIQKAQKEFKSFLEEVNKYLSKNNDLDVKIKHGGDSKSTVTEADNAIEKIFSKWLDSNFTNHDIYSEEILKNSSKDWVWYIDPIDGTTLFSRNIEEWGIIVALTYKSEPVLSWVYFPYSEKLYFAGKNLGSFKNGVRIQTSKVNDVKNAVVSGVYLNSIEREAVMIGKLWKQSLWTIVGRSLAKDFCELAEGKIDISVCYECYPWEYKALTLLVQEAGGICKKFTDDDKNGKNENQNLVAFSNSTLASNSLNLIGDPKKLS